MRRREELRQKLLTVLENLEKQHPAETERLLSYLQQSSGGTKIDPQTIRSYAKGILAGIGDWLKEQGLGGFTIRIGLTEPLQRAARGKVKGGLSKICGSLPKSERQTLVRILQELSPLVEESLREFAPEQIAQAILMRSIDGNPKTGSRVLITLL